MFYFVFILLFVFSPVKEQSKDAKTIKSILINRDKEIKDLLGPEGTEYSDEQRDKLKKIINGIIDYDAMAKTALEETYNEITEEQKTEFIEVFSTIIQDQSLAKLDIYRAKVSYTSIDVNNDRADVVTLATLKEVKTPVSYKMHFKNGEWMITDMLIDNVSTAESYQSSFGRVIKKRGFEKLLASLKKRAARSK